MNDEPRKHHEPSIEALAKFLAELINGGSFYDPQFYTDEQRDLWRKHAEAVSDREVADFY